MLDEVDRAIVSYLQYDGRMPFTQIAEALGITEATVRRRVKNLSDNNKLQIVAIVPPREMGWSEAAMIGISTKSNLINDVALQIAHNRPGDQQVNNGTQGIFSRPRENSISLPKCIAEIGSISFSFSTKNFSKSLG